jgi:hypothetical protein
MSALLSQPILTPELVSEVIFSADCQLLPTPAHLSVISTFNPSQKMAVIRVFLPPGDLSCEVGDLDVTQYKYDTTPGYVIAESARLLQSLFEQLNQKLERMNHG